MAGNALLGTGTVSGYAPTAYSYAPTTFDRKTMEEAARACITEGGGLTQEQRWEKENGWIMSRVYFDSGLIIDYGCGVGRIAKALISIGGTPVVGVDHSPTMRKFAVEFVGSERFWCVSPEGFEELVSGGLEAAGAIACWSLQHILDVRKAVDMIAKALKPGALFWTLDLGDRNVPAGSASEPATVGAILPDDGVRLYPLIEGYFVLEATTRLDIWTDVVGNPGELKKWRRK